MHGLVPANPQLFLYLGELLHIVAVVLQSKLGSLDSEADAELPSAFSRELDWLSCKTLLVQRLVFYPTLLIIGFAVDFYLNVFTALPFF